jgi:hypothetical protein
MPKRKLSKRLFKNPDRISSYQKDHATPHSMKGMAREHPDVLQNIEFVLVQGYRQDSRIDDRDAREALRAHLGGKEAEGPRATGLAASLASMRAFREDVSDEIWFAAVRIVEDSVRLHSRFLPGETSYLRFVARYVG